MKKIFFILISVLLLGLVSCQEAFVGQYAIESTPPDSVSNVTYESLPGAVRLTYKLPMDKDLLYVKAYYTLDNGAKIEAAASAFTNNLLLEGFGKGDSVRTVQLVAIDLSKNVSKPVEVKVIPKESPIYSIFNSHVAGTDFGGIYVKWKNPYKVPFVLVVTTPDKAGRPIVTLGGKRFSSGVDSIFNVRGYDSIPKTFYIQVMDRWGNKTRIDTLKDIVPIFEQAIPKIRHAKWNGDPLIPYQEYNASYAITVLWDGKWGSAFGGACFSTKAGGGISNSITYDLNSSADNATGKGWIIPSRVHFYARPTYGYQIEYVRLWGSTSPTVSMANTSGPDAWVLLSPPEGFRIAPPSGVTGPLATAAERASLENDGIDFTFPSGTAPIRYFRWETVKMWGGQTNTNFSFTELTWYGSIKN